MRTAGPRTWVVAAALWLGASGAAFAQAGGGESFPAGGIADVLKARAGKPVTLILHSGKDVSGTVAEVRNGAVVLTRLAGREFYDSIVSLDDVSAVEVRMRER